MSNILFSVLIANYNNGQYIEEAINSVLVQSYTNWEIIIVDDSSSDNSKIIYQKFSKNKKIKIYYNQENFGCTYTKSKCIQYANGEICGFLDADDALLPYAIEKMVQIHKSKPNVSIIFSRHYVCDENFAIIRECDYLTIKEGKTYLTNMQYGPWHFVSFKLSKYKQTIGLNTLHKIGDDQELYLLLEEKGDIYVLDELTYKYRERNNSISHKENYRCWYWNLNIYYEACMRRGLNPEEYPYKLYLYLLDQYAYKKIQKELSDSTAYKIGKLLLTPLTLIKKISNNFHD